MAEFTVALAGNPNTGKTTIFNYLTGSSQHTGNWPGKTVERKEGVWRRGQDVYHIVDLPGAYSLSTYSVEEAVARDFIVEDRPDAVIVVVDATNLERNLYLALQILEMTPYVVLALNMMDAARAQGLKIDVDLLAARLRVPVVPMTARAGKGLDGLGDALVQVVQRRRQNSKSSAQPPPSPIRYSEPIETALSHIVDAISQHDDLRERYPMRWLALKLLQEDEVCVAKVKAIPGVDDVLNLASQEARRLQELYHEDIDTLIADERYTWINQLIDQVVQGRSAGPTLSDRVDAVVMNPVAGLFIFFGVMWAIFKLSTDVAAPFVEWIDSFVNTYFAHWVIELLSLVHLQDTWFASLIVDGVLAGVGGVLVFVPVLMFLYMGMAIMEDSGYMARAAFVMDRYMRRLGLQGKSFVPLVLGFGCNVPAIYATRTLEHRSDRILTGLLVPFMSCSARLPVYVLIATIFFPVYSTIAVLAMYILGIVMALIVGLLLRRTIFRRSEESALLIEIPPYHMPTLRNVWTEMWQRTRAFLQGAATIIVGISIVIWLLMAIPVSGDGSFADTPVDDSAFARLAGAISPIFEPLGFGNWQNTSALMTGFIAKEVVVSTLAQVYHVPEDRLTEENAGFWAEGKDAVVSFFQAAWDTILAIPSIIGIDLSPPETDVSLPSMTVAIRQGFEESSGGYGALAALAFMVYVLIYSPCVATMAAQRMELGSHWMWLSIAIQLTLGWLLALIVFQGGKFFFS